MNLPAILDDLGIPFKRQGEHHHARPNWLQVQCPTCGSSNWHCGIALSGSHANCWRCGPQNVVRLLAELSGQRYTDVKLLLSGIAADLPERLSRHGKLQIPTGVAPIQKAHRDYLRSRRFDPDEIERLWGVQGIGIHPRLSWRLFIPISLRSEVVSWTARAIGENAAKRYIAASAHEQSRDKSELLYGLDYARHAVIVHEGPTDVWRTGPGAVATLGTSYSQAQLAAISRFSVRIICFDAEPAAQARAAKLAADLGVFPGKTLLAQLDSGDPGDASEKNVKKLRKLLG